MKKHVLKCGLSFMLLLMATAMMAQFRVSGNVKDEAGEALVGASIVVKGAIMCITILF